MATVFVLVSYRLLWLSYGNTVCFSHLLSPVTQLWQQCFSHLLSPVTRLWQQCLFWSVVVSCDSVMATLFVLVNCCLLWLSYGNSVCFGQLSSPVTQLWQQCLFWSVVSCDSVMATVFVLVTCRLDWLSYGNSVCFSHFLSPVTLPYPFPPLQCPPPPQWKHDNKISASASRDLPYRCIVYTNVGAQSILQ